MTTSSLRFAPLLAFAMPLTGCVLASNGIDYGSYPIPTLPAPPPVAVAPPPPPPCAVQQGQAVSLAGCTTGDTLVLHGVTFEFDKATLTPDARVLLDQVVAALTSRQDIKVEVDGHTDSRGSDAYNLKLSDARATSVKQYLVTAGIADTRLATRGFGESQPIADNDTDGGREINRRVELKVVESAPLPSPPPVAAAAAPVIDHNEIVVLQPMHSFLVEPGAGIPTSIGVLTTVPHPKEAGPPDVISKRALPPGYAGIHPSMKGYPGSSYAPAASSSPTPAPAAVQEHSSAPIAAGVVAIANFQFEPAQVVVAPASVVTWTNRDNVVHTLSLKDGEHKLRPGESYSLAFVDKGEYPYVCGIHPTMAGKVVVQ